MAESWMDEFDSGPDRLKVWSSPARERSKREFEPRQKTMNNCPFCQIAASRVVGENELAYAVRDGFPVTGLHSLVIPKRHAKTYFELTADEILACDSLIKQLREGILEQDPTVTGFNIGINAGECAGQTVFHCHIHLIPRRAGDVERPRGGVRNVIPGKGDY